jgi:chemotaxis protein MotB
MARKKAHEEHENAERWLVSYADFITLLFAFFTVLYATGQTEKGKLEEAMQSIRSSFMTGGGMFSEKGNTLMPHLKPGAPGAGASSEEKALGRIAAALSPLRDAGGSGGSGGSSPFEIKRSREGLVVRLDEKVLFKPGKTDLTPEAKRALEALGTKVRDLDVPLEVRGYALRDAWVSDPKSWNLALQRAVAVSSYMATAVPFFGERITLDARTEPASGSSGNTRRVEILLKVDSDDIARLISTPVD